MALDNTYSSYLQGRGGGGGRGGWGGGGGGGGGAIFTVSFNTSEISSVSVRFAASEGRS